MNNQITIPHRKELVKMLEHIPWSDTPNLRKQVLTRWEESTLEYRTALIAEIAEKRGVSKLAAQVADTKSKISKLKEDLETIETTLESKGFEISESGHLSFSDDAPDNLVESVKRAIAKEHGSEEEIETKFDDAITKLWLVPTLDEATKLIESLS
jgi:hypothetical protein